MTGLLYTKNIFTKTHQGARAKFSELFIKTPSSRLRFLILQLYYVDYRQEADYDLDEDITIIEAEDLIKKADDFYQLSTTYYKELVTQ